MTYPEVVNPVSDDIDVVRTAVDWLVEGARVALVTVLRTWGSSPRPPGSMLAIHSDGRSLGSVSGGCVEETLIARHRAGELGAETPVLVDFGVERIEAERLGLPCGGRLELLVECVQSAENLQILLNLLAEDRLVSRQIQLPSGEVSLLEAEPGVEFRVTDERVVKVFGPAWQLLLIGDGQIARYLASMGLSLNYRVTICDPRDEFIDQHPLSGVRYSKLMPDDEVNGLRDAPRTAIVTLAHDPRQDDLGLSAAMGTAAFYIGALGSRRSAEKRHLRLLELGHDEAQVARIHAPAGLSIGSKRPAEIALSIMAEITAIRNHAGVGVSMEV
ncbi:MAG: XdhC family protein [Candidatus Thiodiazotropha sp. 6PLUC2]